MGMLVRRTCKNHVWFLDAANKVVIPYCENEIFYENKIDFLENPFLGPT